MTSDWFMYPLLFVSLYFEVFVLLTFFEGKKTRSAVSGAPFIYPSVTVVVPCYNESETVAGTLDSLLALDYPKDKLSIFAVNDGSTDNTASVLARYANDPRITILSKENGGKHTALNLALSRSQSDLVGCLDADSFVAPSALKILVQSFADPSVMATTPAILIYNPKNIVERVQHAEYALSAFVRRTFSWLDALFITPGPFSLFRREVFEKLGPYRAAYNTEDMEIALRMQQAGMKIENNPHAHVFTRAPRTYPSLYRQRVRWTYGFLKNAQDYREMFFNPKYGTLGMFILPFGLLSIFPAVILMGFSLYSLTTEILTAIRRISVIGFTAPTFSFDWFFFDTRATLMLMVALVILATSTIIIGKKIVGEKKRSFDWNIVLYLLLYGFFAPFWLARAGYDVLASKERTWAREIDERRKHG